MNVFLLASGDLWAGAEAVVYHLARGLQETPGMRPVLVCLNAGTLEQRCKEHGVPTHVVPERTHSLLQIVRRVVALGRETPPHVLHAHRYKENIVACLAGLRFPQAAVIATVHGISEADARRTRRWAVGGLERLALAARFDRVVCVSEDLRRTLAARRFPAGRRRLTTIHNGIQAPGGRRPRKRAPGAAVAIGAAGRLVPVKDYPFLLRVAAQVCGQRENVSFFLAGDGPQMGRLRQEIRARNLQGRVHLLGHVASMAAFYRSLDLFVNTSLREGIPMTLLEAASHGVPSVAMRVGGIPEIIEDGANGLLVRRRDPETFAQRLAALIEDRRERLRLGEAARETVRTRFSVERMLSAYCRVYAAGRGRGGPAGS